MEFPPDSYAVIVDTDKPVTEHFAFSMCAYSTGIMADGNMQWWAKQFFQELKINQNQQIEVVLEFDKEKTKYHNPYLRWHQFVTDYAGRKMPACPWPTKGYGHNGNYDYVNLDTKRTFTGRLVPDTDILEKYTFPAHLSVAIFFSKEMNNHLAWALLKSRIEKIAMMYPNERCGGTHKVLGIRQEKIQPLIL